jgi:ubiquinone/menaquinone biosynthesis C-methylase UbiE
VDLYDLDMRAQIWRYNPRTNHWQRVHVSPLVDGIKGRRVPREIGYRNMIVFQGKSDPAPALYVSTMSWVEAPGALFLRSLDGLKFTPVSEPGLKDSSASSFRSIVNLNGRLYTSPAGSGSAFYSAQRPLVVESDNPRRGVWRPVSEPAFGDSGNTVIGEFAVFNDYLYAGTVNPERGYQIWKTRAVGKPPYRWTKVVGSGAGRGKLNEGVLSFCVFNQALYVGGHISMGGHDKKNNVGPAAAELIRLYPDDTWDIVVGTPQVTLQGYKVPLSGMGPGFGNPFNGYFWCMQRHDGWLYVGTFDSTVFLRFADLRRTPHETRTVLQVNGIDNIIEAEGGFDLWRSRDGLHWTPVTNNGFRNPYNYGARNIVSTPYGLFLGTANPFGPRVAVERKPDDWVYEPNHRGGLEVWVDNTKDRSGNSRTQGSAVGRPYELAVRKQRGTNQKVTEEINRGYDDVMFTSDVAQYYGHSDFSNWGYWLTKTRTQKEACHNLMEKLLSFIPEKRGSILDVACGKGATTRHLLEYFPSRKITGINISSKQLERCREKAPGVRFLSMDATELEFPNDYFDNLICVEAAFHFNTRRKFFGEAYRVLKPGGHIVLSDILFSFWAEARSPSLNAKNWIEDPDGYREILSDVGFHDVHVIDATEECWHRHDKYRSNYILDKFKSGEMDLRTFKLRVLRRRMRVLSTRYYVLASGIKL